MMRKRTSLGGGAAAAPPAARQRGPRQLARPLFLLVLFICAPLALFHLVNGKSSFSSVIAALLPPSPMSLLQTGSLSPPGEALSVAAGGGERAKPVGEIVAHGSLAPLVPLPSVVPNPFASDYNATCTPAPPHPLLGPSRSLQWITPPDSAEWPVNCAGKEELCEVLRSHAVNREVMVAVANSHAPGLAAFLDSIKSLNISNFLVVAIDVPLAEQLKRDGVPYYYVANSAQGNHKVSAQKFSLLKSFVSVGCSVLLTDTDVLYLANPFPSLHRDSDVESMSDGWDVPSTFGWLDPIDDAALGPRSPMRHGFTLRAAALNSGLWFVAATAPTLALMAVMEHRLATEDLWDQSGYNQELFLPTHDEHYAARASVRVMSPLCFVNSKVLYRHIRFSPQLAAANFRPVAIHVNYHADKPYKMQLAAEYYLKGDKEALNRCVGDGCREVMDDVATLEGAALASVNDGFVSSFGWHNTRAALQAHGCAPRTPWDGKLPAAEVAFPIGGRIAAPPPGGALPCPAGAGPLCEALAGALLARPPLAPAEVLLTVAGAGDAESLVVLLRSVAALRLEHRYVVVALDDGAAAAVRASGVDVHLAVLPAAGGPLRADASGGPLPAASVKWAVLAASLSAGVGVLALDADCVLLADPFGSLYRDADFEALADGWDETSVWGYDHVVDDPTMGWSRYVHGTRMSTRDPGLVLAQATEAAVLTAQRVARRLASPGAPSERAVFNQETWLPSHGEYTAPGASLRVMNFLCFANSKNLLRLAKDDALRRRNFSPIAARMSYHDNKPALASGTLAEFGAAGAKRIPGALEKALKVAATGGGRSGLPAACAAFERGASASFHKLAPSEVASSQAAAHVAAHGNWSWAGIKPFNLLADGTLITPWGNGEWGLTVGAPPAQGAEAGAGAGGELLASFGGANMVLQFEDFLGKPFGMFVATRCSDGDLVLGRPA